MAEQTAPLQIGTYIVDAPCPRCGSLESILIRLTSVLTEDTDSDVATLRARMKAKAVDHMCGSRRLLDGVGMLTVHTNDDKADKS